MQFKSVATRGQRLGAPMDFLFGLRISSEFLFVFFFGGSAEIPELQQRVFGMPGLNKVTPLFSFFFIF